MADRRVDQLTDLGDLATGDKVVMHRGASIGRAEVTAALAGAATRAEAAQAAAETAETNAEAAQAAAEAAQAAAEAAQAAIPSITAVLAAIMAGTNVTIDRSVDGQITIASTGGGGTPTPPTDDIYFGLSADEIPLGSELTIPAVNGVGTIAAYVGSMHQLIARLATEGDITSVLFSDDASNTNQVGAFTKYASTVIPTGETEAFNVWVSNQNLSNAADVIITVS